MKLQKNIYLEGPDGAGKSQLLHQLAIKGLPIGGHSGGPVESYEDARDRLMSYYGEKVVRDRCLPISQQIYDDVLGRERIVEWHLLNRWIAGNEPMIIYCRPPVNVILAAPVVVRAHKPVDHADAVRERREALIEAYDQFMFSRIKRLLVYDWTTDMEATSLLRMMHYFLWYTR